MSGFGAMSGSNFGRLTDGQRLRFPLREASVKLIDSEFKGKKYKRTQITITDETGEEVIYQMARSVFPKIRAYREAGAVFIEIKREDRARGSKFTEYHVKGYKSREGRIIGELIELAEQYEEEDDDR